MNNTVVVRSRSVEYSRLRWRWSRWRPPCRPGVGCPLSLPRAFWPLIPFLPLLWLSRTGCPNPLESASSTTFLLPIPRFLFEFIWILQNRAKIDSPTIDFSSQTSSFELVRIFKWFAALDLRFVAICSSSRRRLASYFPHSMRSSKITIKSSYIQGFLSFFIFNWTTLATSLLHFLSVVKPAISFRLD